MGEETPEATEPVAPKRRLPWHAIVGVLIGIHVGGALGGIEGARQAYFEALAQGTGADAGIYLVVFGPMVTAILAGMGLAAGAFAGGLVGLLAGTALERARRSNEDEDGLLGHPVTYWLLHLGLWVLLVYLAVHFVEPLEHLLHVLGIVAREAPRPPAR